MNWNGLDIHAPTGTTRLKRVGQRSSGSRTACIFGLLFTLFLLGCSGDSSSTNGPFETGDRIAWVGGGVPDRMQHDGWVETWLHLGWPDQKLQFRPLAFTGDRLDHQPRAHPGYGNLSEHVRRIEADHLIAFFGYNESFDRDPTAFRHDLVHWIEQIQSLEMSHRRDPLRVTLVSPLAFESGVHSDLPSGDGLNRQLDAITEVMHEVAAERDLLFVDLFHASQRLYRMSEEPVTHNGIHPNEEGHRWLGQEIVRQLSGRTPSVNRERLEWIREAVVEKSWFWFNRYRATSGNDIWGTRGVIQGNRETQERELIMLDSLVENRDRKIHARLQGRPWRGEDGNVPEPLPVETTLENADEVRYLPPAEALETVQVADSLQVGLFASEAQFPELINPVQLKTDHRGRIWASTWATYPKWEPMKEMNDRILVLEDEDGDGVADRSTTFAEVHNPTGFEFWNDGVIVVSAPNILYLRDTDGDDRADERHILLSGIDSADTHHSANNILFSPDGWIYYQRGVFLRSNIETPWAEPLESTQPGLYRFNPRTAEVEFVVENDPNPHGISIDDEGRILITDATTGRAWQVVRGEDGFRKVRLLDHTVRPVPGNMLASSSHLPESLDGSFLIFNVIGFQGAKAYRLSNREDGLLWGEEIRDLFWSDDPNFRPTDGTIGMDGALYVSDWHNAVIGHLQHNLRDPMRDHTHGRIYRIHAPDRPLQNLPDLDGASVEELLDLLSHPVASTRQKARVRLSGRDRSVVMDELVRQAKGLNEEEVVQARHLLELLWLSQQMNRPSIEILNRLLGHTDDSIRRAAESVRWELRHQEQRRNGVRPLWQTERSSRENPTTEMVLGLKEEPPLVVFVTGDEEYRSEESMPMVARLLMREADVRAEVLFATSDGVVDPNRLDHIGGLERLEEADMMVLFSRFRQLPEEQAQYVVDFAQSGKPMAGFRTATHAFRYEEGHPLEWLNEGWPQEVFGLPWIRHHGHESSTQVTTVPDVSAHSVLRGVDPFHARSWLYESSQLHTRAVPLMIGESVRGAEPDGNRFGPTWPVAWTHRIRGEGGTSRVFFTTLGHPEDFKREPMRRLALQGIFWALGLEEEIPVEGLPVHLDQLYDPNPSGFGEQFKPNMRPEDLFAP